MEPVIYIATSQNGTMNPVIAPNEMTINVADLDAASTTRNAKGYMVRQRVRGGTTAVRTIELKWQNVPVDKVQQILQLVQGTYFWMRYPDPLNAEYIEENGVRKIAYRKAQFYAGDRKISIKRLNSNEYGTLDGSTALLASPFVKELTFNCIER